MTRGTSATGGGATIEPAEGEATGGRCRGRLQVLISAYSCAPGRGSEAGLGWNIALEMAGHHDVWVLTRAKNRRPIEVELARHPVPGLRFVYHDLPRWAAWWKRGGRGVRSYYYLWQISAYAVARRLHREVEFDLMHHVTFARYWAPSFVALLPIPFIWGPVGGGESAPVAFWKDFRVRAMTYEAARTMARWIGEHDPFVRSTARRSECALATTPETAERLRRLRCRRIEIFEGVGVSDADVAAVRRTSHAERDPIRFISIGRLLHWKGFHLALRALARARLRDAELWIVGDGPERSSLEAAARELGLADRVRFLGALPRAATLATLAQCHALVHPSLHDSGGWVCAEAMLAELPVLCLDQAGPAMQVTREIGFLADARSPESAVRDLAAAMEVLERNPELRRRMGRAARERTIARYRWRRKGEILDAVYRQVVATSNAPGARRSSPG